VWRLRPEPRRSSLVLAAAFALSPLVSFAAASTIAERRAHRTPFSFPHPPSLALTLSRSAGLTVSGVIRRGSRPARATRQG
jgi:hypothetical protein